MSTLTFRSRTGAVAQMPSYPATTAKNSFGKMMQTASRKGAVAITRHNEPEAVLLSLDEYQTLVDSGAQHLSALTAEFDSMLDNMQTEKSRRGTKAAFNASPASLGRAAARHPRKRS